MEQFINKYKNLYPHCTIQDLIKLLYQSELGNNHMITDENQVYEYIKEECLLTHDNQYRVEEIGNDYVRLHLFRANEAEIKTITQLFLLSALKSTNTNRLIEKLNILKTIDNSYSHYIDKYIEQGCPAMHHSEQYREYYKPHYRVIKKDYMALYPLLLKINESIINNQDIVVGIDGMCGAGKSTLSLLLCRLFDAQLFCLDDFFLQSYQRTKERYETPGENIDHERFLKEVLLPLKRKEVVNYRKFDCRKMEISGEIIRKPYKSVTIIEGTYCMHPHLRDYIDYSVVLKIDQTIQLQRLKMRNNEAMFKRFVEEWIPLEHLYFNYYHIFELCDLCIHIRDDAI